MSISSSQIWQPFGKFCCFEVKVAPAISPGSMSSGRLGGLNDSMAISPTVNARLERGAVNKPSAKLTSLASAPSRWAAIAVALVTIFSVAR